jgi:hypothetical protein
MYLSGLDTCFFSSQAISAGFSIKTEFVSNIKNLAMFYIRNGFFKYFEFIIQNQRKEPTCLCSSNLDQKFLEYKANIFVT